MYNCEQFGLLANTLVLSNVVRLFKIPPLRSGGTSAQNINNLKDSQISQNSSLDVVRVVFYLSITSDIILLQINNYILEISYRFLDFVSHLAPSMSNILKCNEHQECLKTAKMGYFPMKMHDFPSIFVKSYYQQHIIMEWDVPHLQHIQL